MNKKNKAVENIEDLNKNLEKGMKTLYDELKKMIPGLPDEYDRRKLAQKYHRGRRLVEQAFFEMCVACFVHKKMLTTESFEKVLQEDFGIGLRQGNNNAAAFQLAYDNKITADRISAAGTSKFLMIARGPSEAIQEFRESGTIDGEPIENISRGMLKEILDHYEDVNEIKDAERIKLERDLEREEVDNIYLLEENKKLKKKMKDLQLQLEEAQQGYIKFGHTDAFVRILLQIEKLEIDLQRQPVEAGKETEVSKNYFDHIDRALLKARQAAGLKTFVPDPKRGKLYDEFAEPEDETNEE